jgi:cell division protein FtsI (penicillin-binding protein 3)
MVTKSPNSNSRIYCLGGFAAFWFLLICVRLVWLQVVDYTEFAQRAARQQQRSIDVAPVRGNIYDRNGNELAMTVSADSVFAVPSEIADIHGTAAIMGGILHTDSQEIENRMRGSHAFAWVARKPDPAASDSIRARNLKGIYFQKESKRAYPKRELAAQVLGYVGLDDDGLAGLERQYETRLAGRPGKILISLDAKRRWFGRVEKNPDPGDNVVLTLDEKIQYMAEHELLRAIGESRAEAGTIIVENPHTGEILALANWPAFDPNAFNSADPSSRKNRAVSDIYEPGSTFKIVTLAAALEEKLTSPEEVVDCQLGSIVLNGHVIHDHNPYGALTVAQILEKSSDVGAIKLALRLGEERLDRYIRAFGFGAQTGIEIPGETRGLTKPLSRWSRISIGAISMGQEIGVSPLQLIAMASTIANDGVFVPPRVVAGLTPPRTTPQLIGFRPAEGRRVISTLTAARMKVMMEGVVLRGTGTRAILDGYSSAGKTGTAQKTDPVTGRYSKSHYIASFTGFAPVNNPAVSVLVVLDSPARAHEGGSAAAPVFSRLAQQVLEYLNVPHDIELQTENRRRKLLRSNAADYELSEAAPDYLAQEDAIPAAPKSAPVQPKNTISGGDVAAAAAPPAGDDRRVPPAPPAPSPVPAPLATSGPALHGTVLLDVGNSVVVVPDFHGKALRSALEEAQSAGLELEVSGSGICQEQSPAAGSKTTPGGRVMVRFGR